MPRVERSIHLDVPFELRTALFRLQRRERRPPSPFRALYIVGALKRMYGERRIGVLRKFEEEL